MFYDVMVIIAVFHDIHYDVEYNVNESISCSDMEDMLHFPEHLIKYKKLIGDIITDTETRQMNHPWAKIFHSFDMSVINKKFDELLIWEKQIFQEYQIFDWMNYQNKRIEFLNSLLNTKNSYLNGDGKHIRFLIKYIKNFKPRIAIYPGSFDPFHIGHLHILEKAEKMFDKVIIARGVNSDKNFKPTYLLPKRIRHYQINYYNGLLVNYIKSFKYPVTVIRGLRDGKDFDYEENQRIYNKSIYPDYNCVYIPCEPELKHVSSSGIKSLINCNYGSEKYENKYLLID